jgi:hypothetical protein
VDEVRLTVRGYPPAKNEALSMLGAGHPHSPRVVALLEAAEAASETLAFLPFEGPIGLDVTLHAPTGRDPWDATNYLGGIGDVLEDKRRRGPPPHLGKLGGVSLYLNDRQIREVHYRQMSGDEARYEVRVYSLNEAKRPPT